MGSGSKLTSTGDSWIFAFIFVLICVHISRTKEHGVDLLRDVIERKSGIKVFGDDFVCYVQKKYHSLFNFQIFSEYIKLFGMKFKEGGDAFNFLTIIDEEDNIITEGIVLLQVYFVHRDQITDDKSYPTVLPYKKTDRLMARSVYGNGEPRMLLDYAASAIGTVWASYGTNRAIYNFFAWFSRQVILTSKAGPDWLLEYFKTVQQRGVVDNILRKGDITIEELVKGYPTREKLLKCNKMDRDQHSYYHDRNDFVDQHQY